MSDLEIRNYIRYGLLALGAFAVGAVTALIPQLLDASLPVLNMRVIWAAGLSALLAAYGGTLLPRAGGVALAKQSDALRDEGYHGHELAVLPSSEVPREPTGLSDKDIDRLAKRGMELMREREERG